MSARRSIKKATYAGIFGIVVVGFFALVFRSYLPDSVAPTPTPSKTTQLPILVENLVIIPHIEKPGPSGKTIDAVARLRNDNARAGTGSYLLKLLVKDPSGAVIRTVEQNAYVLPGGVQYVAFLDVSIPPEKDFGSASIQSPPNGLLMELPDSARLPEFSVFLRERTQVKSGTQELERQTGVVTNNSTFDWEKVEVIGVALDQNNAIVGVGKTFVGKLLLGEQREFTLSWPLPVAPTSRVLAIATTNIYSNENVVHIIGDPNALR